MESLRRNRNERGASSILPAVMGGIIGSLAFNLIHTSIELSHSEDFSEKVQGYNSQLHQQLDEQYTSVNDLVIKHDGKSFTFHTTSESGANLACEGELKIADETAKAIGNISCTQTEAVEK